MLRQEFIDEISGEIKSKKNNVEKALRQLPVLRLKPKERIFADAILEGASPEEAMVSMGRKGNNYTLRKLAMGYLCRPDVIEYLQWVDKSRPVNSRTCRNDAMVRLSKLLRDPKTPPMVAAVAARIALQHYETTQGWDGGSNDSLPDGYVEAVYRIRKKLRAVSTPKAKQIEAIAEEIPQPPQDPCDDNPFAVNSPAEGEA